MCIIFRHFYCVLYHIIIIITILSKFTNPLSTIETSTSLNRTFLVLLDRDGVINLDVGPPGVLSPAQLQLTPYAATAIGSLKRKGHTVSIITNQSCVGKGLITNESLEDIHVHLQTMLLEDDKDAKLDSFYSCTSTSSTYDFRRKPNPGMIHEALCDFKRQTSTGLSEDLKLFQERCIMIGDSWRDLEAAAACGINRRVLVSTGYGLGCMRGMSPNPDSIIKVESNLNWKDTSLDSFSVDSMTTIYVEPDDGVNSVFPFYYTENLPSAVTWFLGSI